MKPSNPLARRLPAAALALASLASAQTLEIGANDFRISDTGTPGDDALDALRPDIAHDSLRDRFLVVWYADDDAAPLVDNELEIYARLYDAAGTPLAATQRLSVTGPDGDADYDAMNPAVAYSPDHDEYLVVWEATGDALPVPQSEIYGQRLLAETATPVGTPGFRISDMGPDDNGNFNALNPDVVYNPTSQEYLVIWEGDDDTGELKNNKFEIYGQRLDGQGAELGADARLSQTGDDTDAKLDSIGARVAYSAATGGYLVAWRTAESSVLNRRIRCQLLDPSATEVGPDDFQLGATFNVYGTPSVAASGDGGAYLVAWGGQADSTGGDVEVYGERVDAFTGDQLGGDLRISEFDDGLDHNSIDGVDVAYSAERDAWLVTWHSYHYYDVPTFDVTDGYEIWGQWIEAANGDGIGPEDFRLSDAGQDGETYHEAKFSASAIGGATAFVVWQGSDDVAPLVDNENEVFGQLCVAPLAGSETVRQGSPPNPNALLPGQTFGPLIGTTWDPIIDHTSFAPNALLDVLTISLTPANVPTGIGTLLIVLAGPTVTLTALPGTAFASPTPDDPTYLGLALSAQGISLSAGGGLELTNALDIVIGLY